MSRKHKRPNTEPKVLKPADILVGRTEQHPAIQLVEIIWIDALAIGGDNWTDEQHITPEAAPSLAVGYIIQETEHTISIVALVNQHHYTHGITIPKGCITSINKVARYAEHP